VCALYLLYRSPSFPFPVLPNRDFLQVLDLTDLAKENRERRPLRSFFQSAATTSPTRNTEQAAEVTDGEGLQFYRDPEWLGIIRAYRDTEYPFQVLRPLSMMIGTAYSVVFLLLQTIFHLLQSCSIFSVS
tara:strand:+ start:71 stop:460 length:390 start_codon:yes stop_codon:yes gene_type:complete